MKKAAVLAVTAMALLALVSAPAALAAEATVGVDFNSAYVFRGDTVNDGAVAQPSVSVSGLPIDLNVWGNLDLDDYDGAKDDGEFSEIDISASYAIPVEGVNAAIGYTEYTYPQGGSADREVSLSVGLDLPLAPTFGVYYGLDGAIDEDLYADFSLGHSLALTEDVNLSLGALIAYVDPDMGEDGFKQYELSASLAYKFISIGVTYIGQADDEVLVDVEDGGRYDEDVVGTISLSYSF